LTEKFVERYLSGTWSNRDLYLYKYDAEGRPDTIQIQKWIGGSWQGRENYFFSYSPEGFIEQINYQQNVGSGFYDYAQIFYTFSADSFLIKQEQQLFTGVAWANFIQEEYTYDADGNLSYFDVYVWTDTAYIPKYRYSLTYETYGEEVAIEDFAQNNLLLFPNPATSEVYIQAVNNIPLKHIQLFNNLGQLISDVRLESATSYTLTKTSGLPDAEGVYFVVCSTIDERKYILTLIVQ
ncbi:MAG: T9SS type A sorting domain-containing protein, partial [Chitinophagales bacterium]